MTLFKFLFGPRGGDDTRRVDKLHRQSRFVSLSLVLLVVASAALVFFVLSTEGLTRLQLAMAAALLTAMLILGFGLPVLQLQQRSWDQYRQLRSILDASGTAVVLFDTSQRVRDFNDAARSYYLDRGVLLVPGLLESDMVRQAIRALADDDITRNALFERAMRERSQRLSDGSAAVVCHQDSQAWHQVRQIALRDGCRAELRCEVGAVVQRTTAALDAASTSAPQPASKPVVEKQTPVVVEAATEEAVTVAATHSDSAKIAVTTPVRAAVTSTPISASPVSTGTGRNTAANDHAANAVVVNDQLLKANAKVLTMTDDEVLGPVVTNMLESHGAEVSLQSVAAMASGQGLLKAYCQVRPDLMILDVTEDSAAMMKSVSTLRALERHQGWNACPVVGISADVMATHRQDYLEAGMNNCLAKPVAQRALLAAVNRCLPVAAIADECAENATTAEVALRSAASGS